MAFGIPSWNDQTNTMTQEDWKKTLKKQAFGPGLSLILVGATLCGLGIGIRAMTEEESEYLGPNLISTGITLMVVGTLGLVGGIIFWRSLSKTLRDHPDVDLREAQGHFNPIIVELATQATSRPPTELVVPPPDYGSVMSLEMEELPSYQVALQLQEEENHKKEMKLAG